MDEETGIHRGEVIAVMTCLMRIEAKLDALLDAIAGEDEDDEEDPA